MHNHINQINHCHHNHFIFIISTSFLNLSLSTPPIRTPKHHNDHWISLNNLIENTLNYLPYPKIIIITTRLHMSAFALRACVLKKTICRAWPPGLIKPVLLLDWPPLCQKSQWASEQVDLGKKKFDTAITVKDTVSWRWDETIVCAVIAEKKRSNRLTQNWCVLSNVLVHMHIAELFVRGFSC